MKNYEEVLVALRRIMRSVDIHSRMLMKTSGLTGPQVILMQAIQELGDVTIGTIANRVNLSQATVSSILDRLVKRDLVARNRSKSDRRIVHAQLTKEGIMLLEKTPSLLQDDFVVRFQHLKVWEQSQILSSVQRLAELMDAQEIEALPVLEIAPISTREAKLPHSIAPNEKT